jgi:hypothetical protein
MTTSNFGSASKCRPKIQIASTSASKESYDGRLTALATKRLAAENAALTVLNLTEHPLPLCPDRIDVPDDVPSGPDLCINWRTDKTVPYW